MIGNVGEYKGLHVILKDTENADEPEVQAITQVGFYNSKTKKYDYFTENEIPERKELENQGYQLNKKEIHFYGNIELLVKILKEKGINIKIENISIGKEHKIFYSDYRRIDDMRVVDESEFAELGTPINLSKGD